MLSMPERVIQVDVWEGVYCMTGETAVRIAEALENIAGEFHGAIGSVYFIGTMLLITVMIIACIIRGEK